MSEPIASSSQEQKQQQQEEKHEKPRRPIITFSAKRIGNKCPFGNIVPIEFTLCNSDCLWIQGNSGRGKTTLSMYIAGMMTNDYILRKQLHIEPTILWDNTIPINERCGILFQQTTLLDELTVAGNIAIALQYSKHNHNHYANDTERNLQIKYYIELVGLNYINDANKKIYQLSGGMSRRVNIAIQLAQKKHVIILDEPFTGLDHDNAISIAKVLNQLRSILGITFILITHQYDIANILMKSNNNNEQDDTNAVSDTSSTNCYPCRNMIIQLEEPIHLQQEQQINTNNQRSKLNLFGITFYNRLYDRLYDYMIYSIPLILLAFIATGLAISMLSADSLSRLDITNQVLEIIEKEIKPFIKMLTNEEPSTFMLLGIRMKVKSMLNQSIPIAKSKLYSIGYNKLMILEVGPLLSSLLLIGRIGGSYSGKIATMYSTQQIMLLQTLNISSIYYVFIPSLIASMIAAPLLTMMGTAASIYIGSIVAPQYNIGTTNDFWLTFHETIFPPIRIQQQVLSIVSLYDNIIEIITWPMNFHILKAMSFMSMTMFIAEAFCYYYVYRLKHGKLPTKDVPFIITSTVVLSSLIIICMDWGFSQLWLLRK